jgi:hypothetical protein
MKKVFILLLVALFSGGIFAQDVTIDDIDEFMEEQKKKKGIPFDAEAKNAFYFELAGNALFVSLNYERFIQKNMSIRVGYGSAAIYHHAVPVMFNFFVGENHRLELGAGVVFLFEREPFIRGYIFNDENLTLLSGTFGYRYQPVDGGFVFRAGLNPSYALSEYEYDEGLFLWFGFIFGTSF